MGRKGKRGLVDHDELLQENLQWREYAWLSCPHPSWGKRGENGEMLCRGVDFRRDKIEVLAKHLRASMYEEWQKKHPPVDAKTVI